MPRYLLIAGPHDRAEAQAVMAARKLIIVFQNDRIAVGIDADLPCHLLPDGHGAILGHIFDRAFQAADFDRFHRPAPSLTPTALARDYWGSYVAILERGAIVARDPSGAQPAYFRRHEGHLVISNDADLLSSAFAVNWDMLFANIASEGFHDEKTCLDTIGELRPGMYLEPSNPEPIERPFWSPWDYCAVEQPHTRAQLAEHLETVICKSVASLVSSYRKPLCLASGGLDSSIVLAALAAARVDTACLTIFTADPSGDERHYASLVSDHLGFPLLEARYDPEHVSVSACAAPYLPHPKRRPLFQSMARVATRAAEEADADIFINGNGGDQIFSFMQSATPILDCWKAGRPLLEILAAFENISLLTGCSITEALRGVWRRYRKPTAYAWPQSDAFLKADAPIGSPQHPWLDCPANALPGKAHHIAMILRMQEHMECPFESNQPPMITPLMAQPILEACLAIPSWQWIQGGQNRSVARDAFRRRLPEAILSRKGKPGPASFSALLLQTYLPRMKERLLDGHLAQQGIIDRVAVEVALADIVAQDGDRCRRLLQLADAEAWCAHWHGRSVSLAHA
ncbi:MAG: hypothetical protein C0494_05965 [Sphingobium sp.]|nr:hypothetical protein [Sphingobium sp.]